MESNVNLRFAVHWNHILVLKCDWQRAAKMCFLLGSGPYFIFLPVPSAAKFVVMLLLFIIMELWALWPVFRTAQHGGFTNRLLGLLFLRILKWVICYLKKHIPLQNCWQQLKKVHYRVKKMVGIWTISPPPPNPSDPFCDVFEVAGGPVSHSDLVVLKLCFSVPFYICFICYVLALTALLLE